MSDETNTRDATVPEESGDAERTLRVTPGYVEYYFDGRIPTDAQEGEGPDEDGAAATDPGESLALSAEDAGDQARTRTREDLPVDGGDGQAVPAGEEAPGSPEELPALSADEYELPQASRGRADEASADVEDAAQAGDDDSPAQDGSSETDTDDDTKLPDGADDGDDMQDTDNGLPGWLDLLLTLACTLVLVVLIRTFIAEAYEVPTGSMLETIQLGDRLVGEKVSLHWRRPQEGDIITFNDPDGSGDTLIKRVIATAGQVVDLQDGSVVVDGEVKHESYTLGKPSYPLDNFAENLTEKVTFPLTVPAGHVWVMGDNRTNSLDSRYFGPVALDQVTSIGVFIFWPPSDAQLL